MEHDSYLYILLVIAQLASSSYRQSLINILSPLNNNLQLRKDIFELRARRGQQPGPSPSSGSGSSPKLTDDKSKKSENEEQTDHAVATSTTNDLKLPPLEAPPQDTANPFPLVTSREIGWRAERKYNLEVYGRWGKPKYSIINQLKWPNDAVP